MSKKKREPLRLNLGCGRDKRLGYVNVDVDPRLEPDVVHNLLKALPFKSESAQEIILQDVLEHFTKEQAEKLLSECARVLMPDGILHLRVPNAFEIFQKYRLQSDLLMLFLYGDTTTSSTWGAHKYGYTPSLLSEMVSPLNLKLISQRSDDTNYIFELHKEKLSSPKIMVYGSGWRPDNKRLPLTKFTGSIVVMCTDLVSLAQRITVQKSNDKIVWCLSKVYPQFLSKTLLRYFSTKVSLVVCKNEELKMYASTVLKHSHLKIVVIN